MRKINYGLMSMLALLMCAITSCGDAERPSYDGPNYILFSDTLTVLAVQNNEEVFDIPVAATEACSYDRIIRKSKFPPNPERSVQFSGKRTKRSVQKKGCTQHL